MEQRIIDVNRKHPIYEECVDKWNFYQDSYLGGQHYVKPVEEVTISSLRVENSYLYPHELEFYYPQRFKKRHERSVYDNWCALPIDTFIKYVYSDTQDIVRTSIDSIDWFTPYIENIDLLGTHINDFMRLTTINTMITGLGYIMVDKAVPEITPVNRTDESELNVRSYASYLNPQSVVNWSMDNMGVYNWVLIKSTYRDDKDYSVKSSIKTIYYLWTPDETYFLDKSGKMISESELQHTNPIQHNLGVVPLIPCIYSDVNRDGIPESFLASIAELNREIYNIDSLYNEELYKIAFARLLRPQSKDDWTEGTDKKAGESRVDAPDVEMVYPADGNPPQWLTFPVDALVEKRERKSELIQNILRIATLGGQSGVSPTTHSSGIAMAFAYSDAHNTAAQIASKAEAWENKLWEYIMLYDNPEDVNNLGDNPIVVEYPKTYNITDDEKQARIYAIHKEQFRQSPTALKLLDMEEINTRFGDLTSEEIEQITRELEDGYMIEREQDRILSTRNVIGESIDDEADPGQIDQTLEEVENE